MSTFHEQRSDTRGPGFWSRNRWLAVALVAMLVAVAVVLVVAYSGGGGGGGGGY